MKRMVVGAALLVAAPFAAQAQSRHAVLDLWTAGKPVFGAFCYRFATKLRKRSSARTLRWCGVGN